MKRSTTFNILYHLSWIAVAAFILFMLLGCAAFQPKPTTQAPVTVQSTKPVGLDTPLVIQELTDAGCDILSLEVEKSKRRERLIVGCREIGVTE